jgi:hypothetical protein
VRIPDFFIVGAPKCGTTAMYRWLAAHPEVFVPVKEIHYFGSDLAHRRPPVSEERYRALFADAVAAHRAVGDVAVWYLMSESAVDEIHAFNPDARIIVMLRRPDDMLYSLHSQLLYSGEEDLLDFGAALDAESERAHGRSIPESTHRGLEAPPTECLLYSRVASFADQVERYQQRFEHVHVVLHDDIKADAAGAYRGVLDFLGVEPSFEPDFSVVNPNTKAKSQLARKLIQGVWFGPLRSLVPAGLRGMGRRGLESLQAFNTQTSPRPPLDEHLRQRVQTQLGPDMKRLASLIGRDLSSWMMD